MDNKTPITASTSTVTVIGWRGNALNPVTRVFTGCGLVRKALMGWYGGHQWTIREHCVYRIACGKQVTMLKMVDSVVAG